MHFTLWRCFLLLSYIIKHFLHNCHCHTELTCCFCRITYRRFILLRVDAQRISPWLRKLLLCRNHCCQSSQTLQVLLTGHRVGGGCGGLKTSCYANDIQLSHHSLRDRHWPRTVGEGFLINQSHVRTMLLSLLIKTVSHLLLLEFKQFREVEIESVYISECVRTAII